VKKYIDDINFFTKSQENLAIYKNNKERVYLTYLKPDVKTKIYNAVKEEHLSSTLFAYYNCDRSKKVLSDKEAATMRAMKIDNNNFDFTDENLAFNPFKGKNDKDVNKDFDSVNIILLLRLKVFINNS
jgi:NurA-like 5'-3' nuclease